MLKANEVSIALLVRARLLPGDMSEYFNYEGSTRGSYHEDGQISI